MTTPFWGVLVGYKTPFRVNFMHPSQFTGTAKPIGFRETHFIGVPKSPKVLKSELPNSHDGSIFGHFRRL